MKKSIIVTYPDFGALPNAIKQFLLTSESFFFEAEDPRAMWTGERGGGLATVTFTLSKSAPEPTPKLMPESLLHEWAKN